MAWKQKKDPLLRGDAHDAVQTPSPLADPSIVRHILYLDGPGRDTPYLSVTEDAATAEHFAGRGGAVWSTTVATAVSATLGHRSRKELLDLLKGQGKGDAAWSSAHEVAVARSYVEVWGEHLVDSRKSQAPGLANTIASVFTKVKNT